MSIKITDMTAGGTVLGTEIIPTSKAGAPRSILASGIKDYAITAIQAITAGGSVATGNGLYALQSGALKPVDIDVVLQRALDTMWAKANATPVAANILPLKASGVEKTTTLTALAEAVRGLIEAAILDVSDLASGTVATSDYMLVTQGTTAKKITVQNLYDAIYTGLAAHVAGRTDQASPTGTDVLYLVRGSTAYSVTLTHLAAYVASTATLSGSGTAGYLAQWSSSTALIAGPAIIASSTPIVAGDNVSVPTTAAVRGAVNTAVYDQAEMGAALVDADTVLVNDGDTSATQRKSLMSRLWTYILGKFAETDDSVDLGAATKGLKRLYVATGADTTAGDAATINKACGRFRKDTSGATFTLTNSRITAASHVFATLVKADATCTAILSIVPAAGSAVFTFNAAPTANMDVSFLVVNTD